MSLLIFGLGSNLGKRAENLNLAIKLLSENFGECISLSQIYVSEALVKDGSNPYFKNLPYLNAAIAFNSILSPQVILKEIKKIEVDMGRKSSEKWAPRMIDLDILIYEGQDCNFSNIQIPHAEIHKRDFVLLPLIDILTELNHNEVKKYASLLLNIPNKTAKIYLG